MTAEKIGQLIDSYGNAYQLLTLALESFPKSMWQWKPAPNKWSIHEVIIHIADSEANSYVRARRFLAEPRSGVYGYDENLWAKCLNYHKRSISEALELFRVLRASTHQLIKDVPLDVWTSSTVIHSENGPMKFTDWLSIYEEHVPVHIRQMQRNYDSWKQQHD